MNRSLQLTSRVLRSTAPLQRRMASSNANYVVLGDSSALKGIVESSESKVLYFTATWCPPCKMIAPVFEKLSKDFPATKFVKIDIDDHSDAAADYNIRSVPTFMFYHGKDLKQQVRLLFHLCICFVTILCLCSSPVPMRPSSETRWPKSNKMALFFLVTL